MRSIAVLRRVIHNLARNGPRFRVTRAPLRVNHGRLPREDGYFPAVNNAVHHYMYVARDGQHSPAPAHPAAHMRMCAADQEKCGLPSCPPVIGS